MSTSALAFPAGRADFRRTQLLRQKKLRPVRELRAWSDVAIAGTTTLQAGGGHSPHINKPLLGGLIALAIVLHTSTAWYIATHHVDRPIKAAKQELSIELVRPPKPIEPPKPEPPKVQPQKVKAPPRVVPQIQQAAPDPSPVTDTAVPTVAATPSAPPAPPAALPITAPIGRAGYLNNPQPNYPAQAARMGWQGTVLLHVHVLANGSVDTVDVKQSSGRKVLDDEAINTVKKWSFTPSKQGDNAIDGWATVPIEFSIDQ
jgi:protein TonB